MQVVSYSGSSRACTSIGSLESVSSINGRDLLEPAVVGSGMLIRYVGLQLHLFG